jgi:hypothetical protein
MPARGKGCLQGVNGLSAWDTPIKNVFVCSVPKYDWAAIAAEKEKKRTLPAIQGPAPCPQSERGDL